MSYPEDAASENELDPDDRELPDPADMDPDEGDDPELVETTVCPHCGKRIYEETQQCPQCHNYVTFEEAPARKPPWFLIAVAVCLLIVLLVWAMR